ncbi:hypothetical protein BGZ61DRAFT_162755 [Ilyonectria robusta]|uniref:uncharacterized protein n=1 Tax=Ilyonectria robusta TaxID=1079257 RepID=UPI001E8E79CF|nr:uncharacterized protein BGZ61DRAFT_162755 [Ilyonectria robusta]KAH8733571.1 hypothetical protein BGZ61DRAFT_162755 [Ilyonectria robusta]
MCGKVPQLERTGWVCHLLTTRSMFESTAGLRKCNPGCPFGSGPIQIATASQFTRLNMLIRGGNDRVSGLPPRRQSGLGECRVAGRWGLSSGTANVVHFLSLVEVGPGPDMCLNRPGRSANKQALIGRVIIRVLVTQCVGESRPISSCISSASPVKGRRSRFSLPVITVT